MTNFFTTVDELNKAQVDILWDSVSDNPLLVAKSVLAINQQLTTRNKRIISSINELQKSVEQIDQTVLAAVHYINGIVGNTEDNPALKTELQTIAPTTIEALLVHKAELVSLKEADASVLKQANDYTDGMLWTLDIDGGSF